MICSSEKRLRFMFWSSSGPERTSNWISSEGQRHRAYRPEPVPDKLLVQHENIRGSGYYH